MKKPDTAKVEPMVKLNTDKIPNLEEILSEINLSHRLPNFIKMGVTDSRHLLRLKKMDYNIMSIEWGGSVNEEIKILQDKIQELLVAATVVDEPPKAEVNERDKFIHGRIYFRNFVQSFEYISASFGAPPPLGPITVEFATDETGCRPVPGISLKGKLYVVVRGECTFLEKALAARAMNATALAIVNNEDKLESVASGFGIDKSIKTYHVEAVEKVAVVSLANTSLAPLKHAYESLLPSLMSAHIVPLKCVGSGGCYPIVEEEKKYQTEVAWGHARLRSEDNTTSSFDFLTSTFGGLIPTHPLNIVHYPVDIFGCKNISESGLADGQFNAKNSAVVVYRGFCKFDEKVKQIQESGASVVIVVDPKDSALQRLGGVHPTAGYVKIPSIFTTYGLYDKYIKECNGKCTISLVPETSSVIADHWIEVAHTIWADEDADKLAQIEGLMHKYKEQSADLAAWLRRKTSLIKDQYVKTVETDEHIMRT